MTIELTLFRTGGVEIARKAFASRLPPDEGLVMAYQPVWSALIRAPEGLILFDTGLHPVHIARPDATFGASATMRIVMAEEDAILSRLRSVGVAPEDVTLVVNSHLHFDHAGNNRAFPNATFLVQREHLAFAKGKPNFPAIYWDDPALTYVPLEGETKIASGVLAVPTPGHAPGHQSLVVDLAETGRVVLCGDAAFTRENLDRREVPQPDLPAARASIERIVALVGGDLDRAFPSHDQVTWERLRHAPASYR